jgi:uncharacterized YigZ family protein
MAEDEYTTIRQQAVAETRVSGSRFIAVAVPAGALEEAEKFIAEWKKQHFDATHNCYAYRLGTEGPRWRFNDDGEPSGTAGKPILAAIDNHALTDTLVVVSRYFGGTKLGVGGLMRAYSGVALEALERAQTVVKHVTESVRVSFPHSLIGAVMHVVSKAGARIADTTYDEEVHLLLEIRRSKSAGLKAMLVESTAGNARMKEPG